MAIYVDTREEAKNIIHEGFVKNCELPVFFGKIVLFGAERWLIDFDTRTYHDAAFCIIEDHSYYIPELLN